MSSELEQLELENRKLRRVVQELENTSKMLVRRDMDLREAYEELKLIDKEKSEFISIAAHQLRTPLTAVRFSNQILSDAIAADLDEAQLDILKKSSAGIDRMFETIEDLLTVDALDYGKTNLPLTQIRLELLLEEIIGEFTEAATEKSINIIRDFSPTPQTVRVNPARLKDAVSNLIDNAIKYTSVGGSITITTKYGAADCTIIISDSGIGIENEDLSRLFKKFSRLEKARLIDANGSGLGLYICKKIIEKHNGKIEFRPNKPSGASFIITIPL